MTDDSSGGPPGAAKRSASATEALLHARLYQQNIQPIKKQKPNSFSKRSSSTSVPVINVGRTEGGATSSSSPRSRKKQKDVLPMVPHTSYRFVRFLYNLILIRI